MNLSRSLSWSALLFLLLVGGPSLAEDDWPEWPRETDPPVLKFLYSPALISFRDTLWVTEVLDPAKDLNPHESRPYDEWAFWNGQKWTIRQMPFRLFTTDPYIVWQDRVIIGGNPPFSPNENDPFRKGWTGLTAFDGVNCAPVSDSFNGRVSALAVWNGDLVVAGSLMIEGHPELTHLARWDGQTWHAVGGQPAGGGEARINCLAVYNGKLVAGGLFSHIGGNATFNLAGYDGEGWGPIGIGANDRVEKVAAFSADLYVMGQFTCIGGKDIPYLAQWDGTEWTALVESGLGVPRRVFRISASGLLATPDGLYLSRLSPPLSRKIGATIARWNGMSWDTDLPPILDTERRIRAAKDLEEESDQTDLPLEDRPFAEPRPFPDPPSLEEYVSREHRQVRDMVWHEGVVVALTDRGGESSLMDGGVRIQSLSESGWVDLLPRTRPSATAVGRYRGALLEVLETRHDRWTLQLRQEDSHLQLDSGPLSLQPSARPVFQDHGDSLFVAWSRLDPTAWDYHHVALYDGKEWRHLGDGIPFDRIYSPIWAVTTDAVYLAGRFGNRFCRDVQCLYKWDGLNWTLLEQVQEPEHRLLLGTSGPDLFRAVSPRPFKEFLRAPDHSPRGFPVRNKPRIERWTGSDWETVWEGVSGYIVGFAGDGNDLWAAIALGEDANLVRLVNGTWETVSTTPLPGLDDTDINPLRGLYLYKGRPVVALAQPASAKRPRLAFWDAGQWRWLGGRIRRLGGVIPTSERLWILTERVPDGSRMTWWEGEPDGPEIRPFDMKRFSDLKAACQTADQTDRPDLDLPMPKGLRKYRNQDTFGPQHRPGWHLSGWPGSGGHEQVIGRKNGNTMVLDPHLDINLEFTFIWLPDDPGEVEFEFRVDHPTAWIADFDPLDQPFNKLNHPAMVAFGYPPVFEITHDREPQAIPLPLYPLDDQWHRVRIPFELQRPHKAHQLIFDAGHTVRDVGRLEIRNVRFHKGSPDYKALCKEVCRELEDYDWPVSARRNLDKLFAVSKDFDWKGVNPFSGYGAKWWNLTEPAGIHRALLSGDNLQGLTVAGKASDLVGLVTNQRRWIPGGGLYVANRESFELAGLAAIVADPEQLKFVKGVILDFRDWGYGIYGPAQTVFEDSSRRFGLFDSEERVWGHFKTSPTTEVQPLTSAPMETPWPDNLPVVAIVGPKTPGHLVLLLNALPQVTTIGQPSGPVIVPTRPHLLSNGRWAFFPEGQVFDANGKNVSLCRIPPDRIVSQNLPWDMAVREAMALIGIEPDPENDFCPLK